MNYPKVLINQRLRSGPDPLPDKYNLPFIHQEKKGTAANTDQLYKPATKICEGKAPAPKFKIGLPPKGFKASGLTLTTTKREDKVKIVNLHPYYPTLNMKKFDSNNH